MIRLAFLAVLAVAGLLAFAGYSLVSNTGRAPISAQVAPSEAPALPPDAEPEPEPEPDPATPIYFLTDQNFDTGELVLVLDQVGTSGVVVTDRAALKAAQNSAFINTSSSDGDLTRAFELGISGAPSQQRIAALYRDDELIMDLRCLSDTCAADLTDEDVDYAGLLDVSRPLERVEEHYDNYEDYLSALSFIASDSNFALLGLTPSSDTAHPVPQDTPTATIALPTIYSNAAQPLDAGTHSALLTALITEALPSGVTLTNLTITDHGPSIVVDADNGLPATRGGAEIAFPDVLFYTPAFTISGASDLPDDVMQSLTRDTTQRVAWDATAEGFLRGLGLTCSDCHLLRIKGDSFDDATVITRDPELYSIAFYDLRDTP